MSALDLFAYLVAVACALPVLGCMALLTWLGWLAVLGWLRGAGSAPKAEGESDV